MRVYIQIALSAYGRGAEWTIVARRSIQIFSLMCMFFFLVDFALAYAGVHRLAIITHLHFKLFFFTCSLDSLQQCTLARLSKCATSSVRAMHVLKKHTEKNSGEIFRQHQLPNYCFKIITRAPARKTFGGGMRCVGLVFFF